MSIIQQIQTLLQVTPDGIWGPRSQAALDREAEAEHDRVDAPWTVKADGADLVVENVRCTCFGGSGDSMDSGGTASGVSTKAHPDLKAVSLPMRYDGPSRATRKALGHSPIPMMPFGLKPSGVVNQNGVWVELTHAGNYIGHFPVIDLGPDISRFPKNGIDATLALAKMMDPDATANSFEAVVSYRIVGGAKYLEHTPAIESHHRTD